MRESHRWLLRAAGAATVAVLVAGCGSTRGVAGGGSDGAAAGNTPVVAVTAEPVAPLADPPAPQLPTTARSADGKNVRITDISRIIPLTGSLAETVFSLGLGDHVVARDISTTFAQAAGLPLVTRAHDVSAESVLSLRPTLVLADTDTGPPEALEQIRRAGVPVLTLAVPNKVADVVPHIHTIADALGVPAAGDALAAQTERQLTLATAGHTPQHPLTVAFLYLRGSAGVQLIGGKGSGADSLIAAAGGLDAGTRLGLSTFTPITAEALVAARPDVLLLMTDGLHSVGGVAGLRKIPGIAQTPAGEHGRVITVEDGVLLDFGPRTATVITAIADGLREFE